MHKLSPTTFEPNIAAEAGTPQNERAERDAAVASVDAAVFTGSTFEKSTGGIYLWTKPASRGDVGRGGKGSLHAMKGKKFRGWDAGAVIPGNVKTTAEAIALTPEADYEVIQVPVLADFGTARPVDFNSRTDDAENNGFVIRPAHDGHHPAIAKKVANVNAKTGQVLGIVGTGWRSPQPRDAFGFMDDLLDDGAAKWLAMLAVDGGKRIAGIAQLHPDIIPGGDWDERATPLSYLWNGYDGGLSFGVTNAAFRNACTNGMTIIIPGTERTVKLRHSEGMLNVGVARIRKALEMSYVYFDKLQEEADKLIAAEFTSRQFDELVKQLLPDPTPQKGETEPTKKQIAYVANRREELQAEYDADDLNNVRGTAWGAYQAAISYADWVAPIGAGSKELTPTQKKRVVAENRIHNAFEGTALKQMAHEFITASL